MNTTDPIVQELHVLQALLARLYVAAVAMMANRGVVPA